MMVRIPRPRVEDVRRHVPGELSVNDYGVATASTALIDLLEDMPSSGYELRYSIPFQLAATAADAVLAPSRQNGGGHWAAYQADINWNSIPEAHQALEATARIEYYSPSLARFRVETRSGGVSAISGKLHYFQTRAESGVPLALTSDPGRHAPLAGRYSPHLLQLLMNPVGGSAEPLGRRLHPAGSVPLAAALFQAKRIIPDQRIAAATIEYRKPFSIDSGFVASASTADDGRVSVTLADSNGAVLAKCLVEFQSHATGVVSGSSSMR